MFQGQGYGVANLDIGRWPNLSQPDRLISFEKENALVQIKNVTNEEVLLKRDTPLGTIDNLGFSVMSEFNKDRFLKCCAVVQTPSLKISKERQEQLINNQTWMFP